MLILLRSSLAAKLSPLLVAVAVFFAFSRGRPWAREWLWAVQWYNAATFLLGIAAAGVAAADLARRSRDGSFDVARPAGTSARLSVAIWGSTVVVVVSAYLVGLVAVLLVVAAGGAGGRPDLRGCLPAVLALVAYTALGALSGSLFPGRAVGPLTAVGAAVVTIAVNLAGYSPLVFFGGATVSLVGLELNPPTLWWKSLWALSLTMVCLLLVTRERWPRLVWLAAVGAGGAAVVVTATGAMVFGQNDLRLATVSTSCTDSKPVVCLPADYAPYASQIQTDLEPVLTLLRDRGLPTPERFELGAIVRTGQ